MPCCLFASDEDVEADTEAYVCESCPVADALAELETDPACEEAWRLYRQTVNRFTIETHSVAVPLRQLAAERSPEDFADLMERFQLLFDTLHPAPAQESQEPKER